MVRKKKEPNRVVDLLDELLEDCHSPEDILGMGGLMQRLKKRLVERALAGELNGHLKSEAADEEAAPNSRNGSS
ncbi:MAG: IS256 family transposase, partial [Phormidesmis sp.]